MFTIKKSWIIAALLVVIFCYFLLNKGQASSPGMKTIPEELLITETEGQVDDPNKSIITEMNLYVDVKGEVNKPGVYLIKEEKRVGDLIELAGDFTVDANINSVNLAQKVYDEMVILVPKIGDEYQNFFQHESQSKLRINYATSEEIAQLNGIGNVKARAIVEYREQYGHFSSLEDLLSVSGIGEKTIEKIRDHVFVP